MSEGAKELMRMRLEQAAGTVGTCAALLRSEMAIFEQYEKEAALMESVGPVLAPGLFLDAERQACDALVRPIFALAARFVRDYDAAVARGRTALDGVMRGGVRRCVISTA